MKWIILALAALSTALTVGCTRSGGSEMGSRANNWGENQRVRSADGTRIGFTRVGSGPVPVVIVHGALSWGERWREVATALAEHCTCYLMDRWGRRGSEEHPAYSLNREVEDILAVLDVAGPDVYLLGHSSGAIYTLEAALHAPLAGLILYEPPLRGFYGRFAKDILPRMRAEAQAKRFDEVVSIFLSDEGKVPAEELSRMKAKPVWDDIVALAPQSMREWDELAEAALTVDRYRDVKVPTLLLRGTATENHPSFATQALRNTLPNARTVVLQGQGHTAHQTAPEMVANAIADFLLETSR